MADPAVELMETGPSGVRLSRSYYERPTDLVARSLLGCVLVSIRDGVTVGGRIVETEAYFGADDPASHAARLQTGRVLVMSGPAGIAYMYRSYGIHAMLNVVAHEPEATGAVLIRAIEPVWGLDVMRHRRHVDNPRLLCSGPGRLCQALAIDLDDHGADLTGDAPVWIAAASAGPPAPVLVSGRIGVSRGAKEFLRYFEAGNRFVSAHRQGVRDPPDPNPVLPSSRPRRSRLSPPE